VKSIDFTRVVAVYHIETKNQCMEHKLKINLLFSQAIFYWLPFHGTNIEIRKSPGQNIR